MNVYRVTLVIDEPDHQAWQAEQPFFEANDTLHLHNGDCLPTRGLGDQTWIRFNLGRAERWFPNDGSPEAFKELGFQNDLDESIRRRATL